MDKFRNLMIKRYKRLKNNINEAKIIAMITNQNVSKAALESFLLDFNNLFPNKNITLINIHHCENSNNKYQTILSGNMRIVEYYFNDINKNGNDASINEEFWIGNEEEWLKIMQDL